LRFVTAFEEIEKLGNDANTRKLTNALDTALELSLSNVPHYDGKTAVVIDTSGSMGGYKRGSALYKAVTFGAVLAKANNADVYGFDSNTYSFSPRLKDSVMTIAEYLGKNAHGGSTNFHSIFPFFGDRKYDRVIILSDMQGWMGYNSPTDEVKAYKKKTGVNPYIYSFDLTGYGSLQFPEKQVYALAGFSANVFNVMTLLESDRQALVNEIKKISL